MDVPATEMPRDALPEGWVTHEVRTVSQDCSVTITVRAPLEPNQCSVRAAIGDAVEGVQALLGFAR